jgi:hypothetical protein
VKPDRHNKCVTPPIGCEVVYKAHFYPSKSRLRVQLECVTPPTRVQSRLQHAYFHPIQKPPKGAVKLTLGAASEFVTKDYQQINIKRTKTEMKHIVTTTRCTPYTRYPPLIDVPTAVLRRRWVIATFLLIVAKERCWQHSSLHWFFLWDKTNFSEIKQHQPQLFPIKKVHRSPSPMHDLGIDVNKSRQPPD